VVVAMTRRLIPTEADIAFAVTASLKTANFWLLCWFAAVVVVELWAKCWVESLSKTRDSVSEVWNEWVLWATDRHMWSHRR
jgi:hypothetical protein